MSDHRTCSIGLSCLLVFAVGMCVCSLMITALVQAVDVPNHAVIGFVVVVLVCLYIANFAYSWWARRRCCLLLSSWWIVSQGSDLLDHPLGDLSAAIAWQGMPFASPLRLTFAIVQAMSVTTTANWVGNFAIALSTPVLLSAFGERPLVRCVHVSSPLLRNRVDVCPLRGFPPAHDPVRDHKVRAVLNRWIALSRPIV